jgi:uncharacterized protein (DUF952 family)
VGGDSPALQPGERIYHLATAEDWAAARREGEYRTSTLGRTLEEEGYIHASRASQVSAVATAFYGGLSEPLVLLEIHPERLPCEVRLERPPGGTEHFPHIYGPLDPSAVVSATAYVVPPKLT